jgi:hypothetical protein
MLCTLISISISSFFESFAESTRFSLPMSICPSNWPGRQLPSSADRLPAAACYPATLGSRRASIQSGGAIVGSKRGASAAAPAHPAAGHHRRIFLRARCAGQHLVGAPTVHGSVSHGRCIVRMHSSRVSVFPMNDALENTGTVHHDRRRELFALPRACALSRVSVFVQVCKYLGYMQ